MKNLLKANALILFCALILFAGCAADSPVISNSDNISRDVIKAQFAPPPETQRELKQKEKLRPLAGGGGGGPDFEISDFQIRSSRISTPHLESWLWGDSATFTYDPNGLSEEILFRVRIRNITSDDFGGTILITVYPTTSPGPSPVGYTTPYVTIPAGLLSEYFTVDLRQLEQIERGRLSSGTHKFKAKIKYYDGADWETVYSVNQVTLILNRAHPSGRAIPRQTFHLTSETTLTGSVERDGTVGDNLEASSSGPTRGFISFNLSPVYEKIEEWRNNDWNGFEVKEASLEIEQNGISVDLTEDPLCTVDTEGNWLPCDRTSADKLRQGHEKLGGILLDLLDYGDTLTSSDYDGTMMTNLHTFQSACAHHTFNTEPYVRFQLTNNSRKIQFRLRLLNEGRRVNDDPVTAWFTVPCSLTFTIQAKE